jgi:hypothetical protein
MQTICGLDGLGLPEPGGHCERPEASAKNVWTKQQEEEWKAFQSFQKDYSLPDGAVERSDRPDVLIHGDKTLGIELTTLYIVDGQVAASEQR